MKPLNEYAAGKNLPEKPPRYLFTDIDDTLTNGGYLLPQAYRSLWALSEAGLAVIPVTGRPAGWCDMIIRQWPVKAVVGENGAFVYFRKEGGRIGTFTHPSVTDNDTRTKLKEIEAAVLAEIPGTRVARDQFGRIYDLAIDFREDPPDLGMDVAVAIRNLCERYGACAKISSIHVNTWFGAYDKLSMVQLFMKDYHGLDEYALKTQAIFCGDSPNDEPMFSFFPLSFGVGNIRTFSGMMQSLPAWIADGEGGLGFSEIADAILSRSSLSRWKIS